MVAVVGFSKGIGQWNANIWNLLNWLIGCGPGSPIVVVSL